MNKWLGMLLCTIFSEVIWAADIPAVLQWSHRVEISAPVSGVVQSVHVDAGDHVNKGQVLLALDSATYQSMVAESQAAMTRLSEEFAEAKRDRDRVQELYNRTVISTTELDQAKLRYAKAQSMLAEARARLNQNRKFLNDATVRAPYDAVVVARQVEPGMTVATGIQPQTLMVLAKSGEMLAESKLSGAQIEKLKVGQSVTVSVGNQRFSGKVKLLGLEPVKIKDESAVYPVGVVFPITEQLRAGTSATVNFP
ncbi:efflux RND transporter periplasmic adaptor subunit [Sulfurirhabdus autotrophica]|uniref:RND family efflux transporter MFP subunit n=1 Tax=Sulfurirhabdus autotrophica TaxID=1706046 RepID=A0A4R3YBI4_9PROT|nr:efflux RND transporter periplasmic adaptor subunit [Sulfurirhabdus autotrophica]TCV89101.1 RND family efflux transporter MFP subunit [Sulfurirhabdus autotrophica]